MSVRNLDKLFKPRSVALIGATPRPGAVGAVVAHNLRRAGFAGELMFVNPHHHAIEGLKTYPTVASLPEPRTSRSSSRRPRPCHRSSPSWQSAGRVPLSSSPRVSANSASTVARCSRPRSMRQGHISCALLVRTASASWCPVSGATRPFLNRISRMAHQTRSGVAARPLDAHRGVLFARCLGSHRRLILA
jgi:hypothetical protein